VTNQVNQVVGPGNTGDVLYFMRVMLFITLLSMGYVLRQPDPGARKEEGVLLLPDTAPEWPGILPWQRKASERAVQKYAEVQEKKWQHWNKAMFAPDIRRQRQQKKLSGSQPDADKG